MLIKITPVIGGVKSLWVLLCLSSTKFLKLAKVKGSRRVFSDSLARRTRGIPCCRSGLTGAIRPVQSRRRAGQLRAVGSGRGRGQGRARGDPHPPPSRTSRRIFSAGAWDGRRRRLARADRRRTCRNTPAPAETRDGVWSGAYHLPVLADRCIV